MTGEVVTGTDERLATGDAVNVAARLEQAASPGDVLIGEPTLDLVRDATDAEPIEPLVLKGKIEPVPASGCFVSTMHRGGLTEADSSVEPRELECSRPWDRAREGDAVRAGHDRR